MSEQWTWQPIQDSDAPTVYGGNIQVIGGAELHIYIAGRRYTKQLREGYALCRRVPAPQGVSVPYPIRSVLDAALIVYITECRQVDDPDGETLAHQAQQWLDSQPS